MKSELVFIFHIRTYCSMLSRETHHGKYSNTMELLHVWMCAIFLKLNSIESSFNIHKMEYEFVFQYIIFFLLTSRVRFPLLSSASSLPSLTSLCRPIETFIFMQSQNRYNVSCCHFAIEILYECLGLWPSARARLSPIPIPIVHFFLSPIST